MASRRTWFRLAVLGLLVTQALQIIFVIRGESLTFDEGDHMYAGYRMWTAGDYGLNPEHPPLVKLLATLPVLGQKLWVPPLKGIYFRWEAYLSGKAWLEHNDVDHRLVFRMRLAAAALAIALSCLIFFCTLEWFGNTAALFALVFAIFDPNLLAHSGLVTTDIGATLFFLAVIYTFYCYVKRPTWLRLSIAGAAFGLLLATKHSGILAFPMLLLLSSWEVALVPWGKRLRMARRLAGALAVIWVVGIVTLWSSYGFRYAARPVGLEMNPLLSNYIDRLTPMQKGAVWWTAHLRLLPESYLMGLTDLVHISTQGRPSIVLGKLYTHSAWWHLPAVLAIKTTLGLMVAIILAGVAISIRRLGARRHTEPALRDGQNRETSGVLAYLLVPGAVYAVAVMRNGLNNDVRYLLPLYALAVIFAGAGLAMLGSRSRRWMWVCMLLAVAHIASALSVLPSPLAYSNEAWEGARNTHLYLSDSNVDWGQQLIHLKRWQDRHPSEECWLSYFVSEFISPESYGVHCHKLPLLTTSGQNVPELVPPVIHGSVLISAVEVSSLAWGSPDINPYRAFRTIKPDEEIDYGLLVFRGDVHMEETAAVSRVFIADAQLQAHKLQEAFELASEAVKLTPGHPWAQWELGDTAAALGKKDEARAAYQAAIVAAKKTQTGRSADDVKELEETLKKL